MARQQSLIEAPLDPDELRLPRLVRAQLRRRRRVALPSSSGSEIEERVREELYGKTYYGTRKRVFTNLEGGNEH